MVDKQEISTWILASSPSVGRYAAAAKRLKPLEVVLNDRPAVIAPQVSFQQT